jgi:hypothetical protein
VQLSAFEDPPETLVVLHARLQLDGLVVAVYGVEEPIEVVLGVVDEVLAVVADVAVGGDELVGGYFVVVGVEVEQLEGLGFSRLDFDEDLAVGLALTHLVYILIIFLKLPEETTSKRGRRDGLQRNEVVFDR